MASFPGDTTIVNQIESKFCGIESNLLSAESPSSSFCVMFCVQVLVICISINSFCFLCSLHICYWLDDGRQYNFIAELSKKSFVLK